MKMSLPKIPSELLRLALDDFDKIRNDDRYIINMNIWHCPSDRLRRCMPRDVCCVCLAGAVMSSRLETEIFLRYVPSDFVGSIRDSLYALDHLRIGLVQNALVDFLGYNEKQFQESGLPKFFDVQVYTEKNYEEWRRSLLELADMLEKAGF